MGFDYEKVEQAWIKPKNNVLDELEEWVTKENEYDDYKDIVYRETMGYVLDKIQELKKEMR